MSLSQEQKENIGNFIVDYRWQISLTIGILLGLFGAMLTNEWMFLFVSSGLAGLIMYTGRTRSAVGIGALSVLITDLILFLLLTLSGPALAALDLFGGLILGSGFGWLILLIILIIGTLIGASGGFIGASISIFIPWPQWAKSNDSNSN